MMKPQRAFLRSFTSVVRLRKSHQIQIKSLEDLAKLESLEDVDPELVKRLINERTNELNIQNELQMLKNLQSQEKQHQDVSLRKFVRPAWMFLLMSSLVYLSGHYLWCRLEHDEREEDLKRQVKAMENELFSLIEEKRKDSEIDTEDQNASTRSWYKRWFW